MNRGLKILAAMVFATTALSCGNKETSEMAAAPVVEGVVTDYSDNKVFAGKPVIFLGRNFSNIASENKVTYGFGLDITSVKVDKSTETSLEFIAPACSKEELKVKVVTKGRESNEITLKYTTDESEETWSDEPTIDLPGAKVEIIREGVEWTSFHGLWAGDMRNINIVRTTLNSHNQLGIFYNYDTEGDLITVAQKCNHVDALVGTNGPMKCCHYVRVDGVTMRVANKQDPWTVNCALTIDNGVVDIVKVADNYAAANLPNQNIGAAGPLLVWNGEIQEYPQWTSEDLFKTTHPRTAFGISKDGKTVIQVAVDGRYTTSNQEKRAIGMSPTLLATLMKGLGCYKALNFDGGGGTAMWIYGKGDQGVVNHPCDNNDWDSPYESLRAAGNTVYIKSDLK